MRYIPTRCEGVFLIWPRNVMMISSKIPPRLKNMDNVPQSFEYYLPELELMSLLFYFSLYIRCTYLGHRHLVICKRGYIHLPPPYPGIQIKHLTPEEVPTY